MVTLGFLKLLQEASQISSFNTCQKHKQNQIYWITTQCIFLLPLSTASLKLTYFTGEGFN